MGIVKRSGAQSPLQRLRKQKEIREKIKSGTVKGKSEALVLVLDVSPSMGVPADGSSPVSRARVGQSCWDAAVEAARILIDRSVQSRVGLAVFDNTCGRERRKAVGTSDSEMVQYLKSFDPFNSGGTCFESGITAGLDLLESEGSSKVRRIVFMTDGWDGRHSGSAASTRMRERLMCSGVILDAVGFGNVNEQDLKDLASITGGVYKHASNASELVRSFKQLEAGTRGLLTSG